MVDWDSPIAEMPEQVTLDYLRLGVTNRVSAEFAASVNVRTWRDQVLDHLVFELTARVLADKLPPANESTTKIFEFEIPATWWQAYKATRYRLWWVRWWTRRHPIRTKTYRFEGTLTVDLTRYHTWPKAKVMPSSWGRPVRVAIPSRDITWKGLT
jgi:hypothetical protein